MGECDCPLMLVHCDTDDPSCSQYDDGLPDDDPIYDDPQMVPINCARGGDCYETACLHWHECRHDRLQP